VPRVLVWDGEGAVGQRRRRQTVLTQAAHAFRGVLGVKILVCEPGDPEAKGLVERANGYLETSFPPGRTFSSPADFNAQLADWLVLVNQRRRRVLGCAPTDRTEADRAADDRDRIADERDRVTDEHGRPAKDEGSYG
jgi:transposase